MHASSILSDRLRSAHDELGSAIVRYATALASLRAAQMALRFHTSDAILKLLGVKPEALMSLPPSPVELLARLWPGSQHDKPGIHRLPGGWAVPVLPDLQAYRAAVTVVLDNVFEIEGQRDELGSALDFSRLPPGEQAAQIMHTLAAEVRALDKRISKLEQANVERQ